MPDLTVSLRTLSVRYQDFADVKEPPLIKTNFDIYVPKPLPAWLRSWSLCGFLWHIALLIQMHNSSANETAGHFSGWGFIPIWTGAVCVFVLIFNSVALYGFLKDPLLRSEPFNTYLVFLLACNILYAVLQNPLDIINNLYSIWWIGPEWSIVYLYATHFLSAAQTVYLQIEYGP